MSKSFYEFIGFMAILMLGGFAFFGLRIIAHTTDMTGLLNSISPWLAAHKKYLEWIVSGAAAITLMAIPPILMLRDVEDGEARLSRVGMAVCSVWFAVLILSILLVFVGLA